MSGLPPSPGKAPEGKPATPALTLQLEATDPLSKAQRELEEAITAQDFERAAQIRDLLKTLVPPPVSPQNQGARSPLLQQKPCSLPTRSFLPSRTR